MIVDRTGREIKPGQILDIPVLALTGAMVPAKVLEVSEPSGLTVPNSVTQEPPFVGVVITLKLYSVQVANPRSPAKVYLCDNTYVVQDAPNLVDSNPELGGDHGEAKVGPRLVKPS